MLFCAGIGDPGNWMAQITIVFNVFTKLADTLL
jgi:hypothetical protein